MRTITGFVFSVILLAGLSACQNKPVMSESLAEIIKPPSISCGISGTTNNVETVVALSVRVMDTNFTGFTVELTNLNYQPSPELSDNFTVSGSRFILKNKEMINTNSVFYFYFTSVYSQKSGIGVHLTGLDGVETAVTNYTLYWMTKDWSSGKAFGYVADGAELQVGDNLPVESLGAANTIPMMAYLQTGYPSAAYMDAVLIAENTTNSNRTAIAEFKNLKVFGNRAQFGWNITNGGLAIGEYYLYMKYDVLDGAYSPIGEYGIYWNGKQSVLAVTDVYVPYVPEPEPEVVTQAIPAVESLMMLGDNGEVVTVRENEFPTLTALLKSSLPGAASADAAVMIESLADGKQTRLTQFEGLPMIDDRTVFYWKFIPKDIAIGGYYFLIDYIIYDVSGNSLTNFTGYWNDKLSHCKVLWVTPEQEPEPETNPAPVAAVKPAITGLKIILKVENNEWIVDLGSIKSAKVNTVLETGTNAAYANLSLAAVNKSSGGEILVSSIKGLEFFDGRIQYGWNLQSPQIKQKGEFYILVRYELLDADMNPIQTIEKYWNEKSSIILN
ncbi:MAG: hypothetical protein HPY53_10495 [Brevinematales bacterium]|nr:hypothetical protein [Brevinematales bacterium]